MAYPKVKITNTTRYAVSGKVNYMSKFCSNDSYRVDSFGRWEASSRGVCLLTKITATIVTPDGKYIDAKPYTSSGTSYSNFIITELSEGEFSVNRYITHNTIEENEIPEDYVEPTEKQK